MIKLFLKKHINQNNSVSPGDRAAIAQKCSIFGIALNVLLFCLKFLAGSLVGAVAITSDAFNNLSDAGSSLITLIGIRLSLKKPDPEHPFGHGRLEYLSGLLVSVMIILMGFELAKDAFTSIIHPETKRVENLVITLVILVVSIFIKLYMWAYNRKYGKMIGSSAMIACATDSISDCISTAVVLITTVVSLYFHFPILDGVCGLVVSLLIFAAGFRSIQDTLVPLLGQPADPEFLKSITDLVLRDKRIVGIHDLVVHDYGPGRKMASLHAEVPFDCSIFEIHDLIDNIEAEIKEKYSCETVIHMDPIDTKDPKTLALKQSLQVILQEEFPRISFHDFRVVYGNTHTNVIFDIIKPYSLEIPSKEICSTIKARMLEKHPNHFCVIRVDYDYSGDSAQK